MNNIQKLALKLEETNEILKESSDTLFHLKDSVTEDETGSNAIMTCVRTINQLNEKFKQIQDELDFFKDVPDIIHEAGTSFMEAKELVQDPVLKDTFDKIYEHYGVAEARLFFDRNQL